MRRLTKFWGLVLAVVLALSFGVGSASADTTSYSISVPNTALACCTGPYASVLVNRTSATVATITFTSLTNGGFTYLMAGAQAVDVNVNASSWTTTIPVGTGLIGFTPGPFTDGGSLNVDGFGVFNQTYDSFDGFNHSSTSVTFTLTNTGGTWGSAGSVLLANGNGALAAIHGFACATPCTINSTAFATGYAANGGAQVPEPASLLLLGSGLAGLGFWQWKRRKDVQV